MYYILFFETMQGTNPRPANRTNTRGRCESENECRSKKKPGNSTHGYGNCNHWNQEISWGGQNERFGKSEEKTGGKTSREDGSDRAEPHETDAGSAELPCCKCLQQNLESMWLTQWTSCWKLAHLPIWKRWMAMHLRIK